jgi:uncharacterized damage-inducible protein DinB
MFRLIEDFDKAWTYEAGATQKIMDALTDRSLSQAVSEGHRTLGRIAWHIVTTIPEMMPATGLVFEGVSANAPMPGSADEIRTAYASVAKQVLDQVKANWSDATLGVADEMYGEKWARGQTLKVLVDHQAHHRGQMTVLMRQAGLAVPGIYGPSKEEWSNYGAQPPEV